MGPEPVSLKVTARGDIEFHIYSLVDTKIVVFDVRRSSYTVERVLFYIIMVTFMRPSNTTL